MHFTCLGATEQERGAELLHFAGSKANSILKKKAAGNSALFGAE